MLCVELNLIQKLSSITQLGIQNLSKHQNNNILKKIFQTESKKFKYPSHYRKAHYGSPQYDIDYFYQTAKRNCTNVFNMKITASYPNKELCYKKVEFPNTD